MEVLGFLQREEVIFDYIPTPATNGIAGGDVDQFHLWLPPNLNLSPSGGSATRESMLSYGVGLPTNQKWEALTGVLGNPKLALFLVAAISKVEAPRPKWLSSFPFTPQRDLDPLGSFEHRASDKKLEGELDPLNGLGYLRTCRRRC